MFINRMNIKNLLESDWSADMQECIVTVRSKITDIINYFRWYYISCNVCSKKITPANGVYPCLNCNKDCKFPLVKYNIHVQVEDNTGKTTFVLFNDMAEKLLDTSAHKLFNKLSSLDNNDVPAHIQSLYEKLELEYKLMKEKKNLIEDESEPKDRVPKELSTEKVSFDILLDKLEDHEEEVHVIDGANSRKRRNLIIEEDDLIDEDTNKFKKQFFWSRWYNRQGRM
ncbi:hypothetical protein FXO38_08217 [Capsicum annuum]|nr:hypothetical protein FXO38_08217 [Capsicum annuum]